MKHLLSAALEYLVIGTLVAVVVVGVFLLERATWRECRRVHPFWYCIVDKK